MSLFAALAILRFVSGTTQAPSQRQSPVDVPVRLIGIGGSLLLATVGQLVLTGDLLASSSQNSRLTIGLLLILVSAVIFGLCARPYEALGGSQRHMPETGPELGSWHGLRSGKRSLLLAAMAVYIASSILSMAAGEGTVVRVLWLIGILLFIGAYVDFTRVRRWRIGSLNRDDGIDIVLLVIITAAGLALRFWRLTEIPSFVHGDIASQGLQALEILHSDHPTWFSVGWSNIPNFDFVMMAWAMRLFGETPFGLSMTAVIQGVLTLPALYLLGREMFGRRAGLIAAALLAISYTHVQFSRIVTTASPLLITVVMFYALFRGLRQRSSLWFGVAGVSLGLGLLVYYPTRVSVVVTLLLFLWLLLWRRKDTIAMLGHWVVFGLGSLAGFGPMMFYVIRNFQAFAGRGSVVTLANPEVMNHLLQKYGVGSTAEVWGQQVKLTFLTFFIFGDSSTHFAYPGPMVGMLTAVLLVLGVGFAVRRLRDPRFFALMAWIGVTLILGGVITNDPPFWPHIAIVLPAVMLLAGVAAERIWTAVVEIAPQARRPLVDFLFGAFLALALLISGVNSWRGYVAWVGDNADGLVRIARYASQSPSDQRLLLVSDPYSWGEREIEFFAHGVQGSDIKPEQIGSLIIQTPTVFILTPNHRDLVPTLQSLYPGGEVAEHEDGQGAVSFITYTFRPEGYKPPPDIVDPAAFLLERTRGVWLLAVLMLLVAGSAGVYLVLRDASPDAQLAPTLNPEPLLRSPVAPLEPRPPNTVQNRVSPVSMESTRARGKPAPGSTLEESQLNRAALTLAGMLLAMVVAYTAQKFYDGSIAGLLTHALVVGLALDTTEKGLLAAGTVLYLIAMVLFAVSAPGLPRLIAVPRQALSTLKTPVRTYPGELPPDARIHWPGRNMPAPSIAAPPAGRGMDLRQQLILLVAALVPYLLAMIRFQRQGEDAAVRWLWLAGLVLFVAGQVIWPIIKRVAGPGGERSPRFRWRHVAILVAILAAGFWLRFNRLDLIPHDLHGDMASMGIQAREWLASSNWAIFREGWANIPMKGFLPSALGMWLFGDNLFGLNTSAVIAGMLTLIGTYLLVWRLFDSHRLAALATAVLTINTPHIHFSRLAAYMDPWPFLIFGTFLVVDGLRARRPASFALAGVLYGLGMEMYYSGRVAVVVMVIALLYLLVTRRDWLKGSGAGFALLVVGVLVALGPSLLYFAANREPLVERSRAVWLFYEPVMTHLQGKYNLQTPWQVLLEQARISLLMFNRSIDSSTQFGYPHPMFSSLVSPLVLLGFGYSLRRWRHPGVGLMLVWLLVMLVNGSILTGDAPFWPRLVGILPAAAVLVALVLDRLWAVIVQALPGRRSAAVAVLLGATMAAFIAYAGYQNWTLYYSTVKGNGRSQALIGRYLSTLPPEIAACDFTDPFGLEIRETAFLAYPRTLLDLPPNAPDGLVERCPGPPFVWIVHPNYRTRLAALAARWPGGRVEEHLAESGALVFTSYLVTDGIPAAAAADNPTAASAVEEALDAPSAPSQPVGVEGGSTAYLPDGATFRPEQTFLGDTTSATWEIVVGAKEVTGGRFHLSVGPMAGHDAVLDYVELRGSGGEVYRFEAEDATVTSGDVYAANEGADGHWWLQTFDPFSGHQALVAQKGEAVPVITTAASVPDGVYEATVGSFTGDPDNGAFALGIRWQSP